MNGWGATLTSLLVNTFTTAGMARCAASAKLPGRGASCAPGGGASFTVIMAPLNDFDCQGKSSGRKVETTKSTASTIVVVCAKINQSLRIENDFEWKNIY